MVLRRTDNILAILCNAINGRRLIKFYYESASSKKKEWRIVEPYILGIKNRGLGNTFLAGLPTTELSRRIEDRVTGHYLIDRMDISKLEILDETFDHPNVKRERIVETPPIKVICRFRYRDEMDE